MDIIEGFGHWWTNGRIKYKEGETVTEHDVALEAFVAGVTFALDKWEESQRSNTRHLTDFKNFELGKYEDEE